MFDVIVIGGGVIGGCVLRELTKFDFSVCLLEKQNDVCMGQSKANSGIVHAGYDAVPGSLKAKFNVLGNKLMPSYAKELGVKYKNNGSLVVAFSEEDINKLEELKERGQTNGVTGLKIINRAELLKLEPNISDQAIAALYAPTAGIVCPYELTIAAIGNAMDNGARLFCDFNVISAEKTASGFIVKAEDGRSVEGRIVINCTGLNADKIANAFGDKSFKMGGRAGEYILLDREADGFVSHTLFSTPTEKGKGVLITPTVDGNVLIGPTSKNIDDGSVSTTADGLSEIMQKSARTCKNIPFGETITSFCGVRAYCDRRDFIIERSEVDGLINCAGIESPGLTSAPAIGVYVADMVCSVLHGKPNKSFNGRREPDCFFKELTTEQKNEIIKRDPAFGRIVCRCEQVTEGEIIRAVRTNPPAKNTDAVKRRTRSGMGRCQGGFCQPQVAEIIARELGIGLSEVTKDGEGSELLVGKTK